MNKSIGVLIVNFKGADDTLQCLEKLALSHGSGDMVACIVDNSCSESEWDHLVSGVRRRAICINKKSDTDDVPESLLIGALSVLLYKAPKNGGFAYGCNMAKSIIAKLFFCEYWLLLNSDAFVDSGAVISMRDTLIRNPNCKMCGAVLWDYPNIGRVQAVGGVRYSELTGRGWNLDAGISAGQFFEKYSGKLDGFGVSYISGACLMITATAWDAVGGMSERYFLYGEELDLAYRAKELGGSVVSYNANVYHKVGSSIGTGKSKSLGSKLSEFYLARSKIMICLSYRPSKIVGVIAFIIFRFIRGILNREFLPAFSIIRGMLAGIFYNLRGNSK